MNRHSQIIDRTASIEAASDDIYTLLTDLEPVLRACSRIAVISVEKEVVAAYFRGKAGESLSNLQGHVRVTEMEPPTALTMAFDGTVEGIVEWTVKPTGDRTLVSATVTYSHAYDPTEASREKRDEATGGTSSPTIRSQLTTALEDILTALQTLCERRSPPVSVAPDEIPAINCPFPAERNPNLDTVTAHTRDWAQQQGLPSDGLAPFSRFACQGHPEAPLPEMYLCSDWYSWLFLYEEPRVIERGMELETVERFQEPFLAVLDGESRSPTSYEDPLVRAFADICQRAAARMPPMWYERFIEHHRNYFASQRWEVCNRCSGHLSDRHVSVQKRRHTAGVYPAFDLIELASGISLSPDVYQHEVVTALRQSAANVLAWGNDLYSLRTDLKHEDVNNLVTVLRDEQNCSMPEAVAQTRDLIQTEIHQFQALSTRIIADSEMDGDILVYIPALEQWIGGCLAWAGERAQYVSTEN